jgi:hypothetical protein
MNREQAKKLLPIIQAFADGADVQFNQGRDGWTDVKDPTFFPFTEWRIKPNPWESWAVVDCDGDMRGMIHRTREAAELSAVEFEKTKAAWCPYRIVHMVEVTE